MTDILSSNNPVDDLAEEFARRFRDGERPSIEDYARRHPKWADEIRDVFPMIQVMEDLKPRSDEGPSVPSPLPGNMPDHLGEYQLLREIGRGGMGVVYQALQETLGRRVAIKVLPEHLVANEKLRVRFRRESQAAARLHHTNIVPVFGVGEQGGLCFYVMQLISGKNIEATLAENRTGPQSTNQRRNGNDGSNTSPHPSVDSPARRPPPTRRRPVTWR